MSITHITENDNAKTAIGKLKNNTNDLNGRLAALEGGGMPSTPSSETPSRRVLNILNVGNSHTEDAWMYVPYMLQEYGIEVRMLIYRAAGTSLVALNTYYDKPYSTNTKLNADSYGKLYYIDTTGESGESYLTWGEVPDARAGTVFPSYSAMDYTVQEAVLWKGMRWDLVIVQDNYNDMASKRVTENTIANRSKLLNRIAGDLLIPPVFGLQIVHTSDYYKGKGYMYGSLSNHRNLFNWLGFDMCFPSGTAIANARQFSEITSACHLDSLLANDGIHLAEGLPCYISSLACMEALFRRFYPWLSVLGDVTRVTDTWKSGKNIRNQQYWDGSGNGYKTTIETSEENALLAQRIAVLSNDHPWDIMSSSLEPLSTRGEQVTMKWVLAEGLWLEGALGMNHGRGTDTCKVEKHSSMGGKVCLIVAKGASNVITEQWEGQLTRAYWTMGGETHEVPIVNNEAHVLIKDICSEVVLTVEGEGLTRVVPVADDPDPDDPEPSVDPDPPNEKRTLNILVLGNSYTQASFGYMPWILETLGIYCRFGMTYQGGATVGQYNEGYVEGFNPTWYYYETQGASRWYGGGSGLGSPQKCVTYPTDTNKGWYWDIIVLNQFSGSSFSNNTSDWGVGELIEKIRSDIPAGANTVFAWNINHSNNNSGVEDAMTAEQVLAKRKQILKNAHDVCVANGINYLFCNGLAVFNAQTNEILDAIGDTMHLRADSSHLQNGLPKFLAAYANTLSLLDQFYGSRYGVEDIAIPSVFYDGGNHGLQRSGMDAGVLDGNGNIITNHVALAKKAAQFAAEAAKSFKNENWQDNAITPMAGLTS